MCRLSPVVPFGDLLPSENAKRTIDNKQLIAEKKAKVSPRDQVSIFALKELIEHPDPPAVLVDALGKPVHPWGRRNAKGGWRHKGHPRSRESWERRSKEPTWTNAPVNGSWKSAVLPLLQRYPLTNILDRKPFGNWEWSTVDMCNRKNWVKGSADWLVNNNDRDRTLQMAVNAISFSEYVARFGSLVFSPIHKFCIDVDKTLFPPSYSEPVEMRVIFCLRETPKEKPDAPYVPRHERDIHYNDLKATAQQRVDACLPLLTGGDASGFQRLYDLGLCLVLMFVATGLFIRDRCCYCCLAWEWNIIQQEGLGQLLWKPSGNQYHLRTDEYLSKHHYNHDTAVQAWDFYLMMSIIREGRQRILACGRTMVATYIGSFLGEMLSRDPCDLVIAYYIDNDNLNSEFCTYLTLFSMHPNSVVKM